MTTKQHGNTGKKYKTLGIKADYDALMTELNKIRATKYPTLIFPDFCQKVGITAQRIYLLKNSPNIGPKLLRSLSAIGIDLKKVTRL